VLGSGALLEDEQFPIAERILRRFLAANGASSETRIVLNGLPRHVGQARDVDGMLAIRMVAELLCDAETVYHRIGTNAGGDRTTRTDDAEQAVRSKLTLYAARTRPLVEHYREAGARVVTIKIGPATTADEAIKALGEAI